MSKLHVRIDYFPWRVQDGLLRFQALEILDIRADANTIEEGKAKIVEAFEEYEREYYSKGYDHHFRRRYHQLYINDGLIVYQNEQAVRDAMASPDKDMHRLSTNIDDEFIRTLLRLIHKAGIQWGKASEKEKDALEEQALYEIERRYREGLTDDE